MFGLLRRLNGLTSSGSGQLSGRQGNLVASHGHSTLPHAHTPSITYALWLMKSLFQLLAISITSHRDLAADTVQSSE